MIVRACGRAMRGVGVGVAWRQRGEEKEQVVTAGGGPVDEDDETRDD